jgi:hypothetical protein
MEMTLKPDSTHYDNHLELDLTKLSGWQEAEEVTQRRIVEGAKKYIQQQEQVDYEWIGTNTFDRPALAGCRAFQLLLIKSPDFLEYLSSDIWKRWAPVIIAVPSSSHYDGSYLELVKRAHLNASEKVINTVAALIDKENQKHNYLFVIDRLDKCWDKQLKLALLEKAKDPELRPKCVGQLLEKLLEHGCTQAGDFAKSLISFPLPLAENEREKALVAARVLIQNPDPSNWELIWSLIQKDALFGRELLELAVDRYPYGMHLNLTETQLADFYIWLVYQYPHDEDLDYSNEVMAHIVTARESVANLRDNALTQLRERGTDQACTEIQRLIQELPDINWLGKTLIDAQANMRRKTWQPLTPKELLQFIISQEPSNSDLLNQIDVIDQRTKNMEDEPKIENRINILNSPNSPINAPVGASGVISSNVTITSSNTKKGVNWGDWAAVIGTLVAIVAIPLSMSVSGVFNEEFKEWFNRIFPSNIEQHPVRKSG